VGGWAAPYGIILVADHLGAFLVFTSALVAASSALHTAATSPAASNHRLYHPLFLILLTALSGVFLTGDLFNLYVFMELVILSSVALVAMAERPLSAEVTFKYAIISALGSVLLLLSVAFVYAAVGTLNMADIAQRARQEAMPPFWNVTAALMLCAFLLKGALFPFHFWQPDAHSAAPAPVSAMLSGVLVKVGIYGIIRMVTLLFPGTMVIALLAPLGAVSALFGALAALVNGELKRILAYSTISNMGLILLALGWGGTQGVVAAIIHMFNHAVIKGGLFLSGGYVAERLHEHEVRRLGGLAALSPSTTLAFGAGAVALAGLPPLSGFVSKLAIFQSGIVAGGPVLLGAAVLASILGIAYSIRPFVLVFWGDMPEEARARWGGQEGFSKGALAPLLLAVLYVILGIWPAPLVEVAASVARELADPTVYIAAVLEGASR
jgi:multicomponent Na+:H+ antiporter subunit D